MEGEFWNQSDLNGTQLSCGGPNSSQGARGGSLCPSAGVTPSMITAVIIMALYSIVCVVGLFGNFLVMYVIIRQIGDLTIIQTVFEITATFADV
ncbi:UNVERIFIED_CONTAM: Mu-type opioid receptor [Gekko kuhli]